MNNKILRNSSGQSILEYVILTTLVGIFCLAAMKSLGKSLNTRINNAREHINRNIELK